ncbi:D-2-hydroxyacid dehydrogenase family protein [Roseibium sp.]|uniref:D-2-hydroxyacid dehydrogenase family protein n=1 Tax=Roseibium sp. TaxID=1936156 RepID=UPI003A97B271
MANSKPSMVLLDDYQGVGLKMADWSSVSERINITQVTHPLDDQSATVAKLAGAEIALAMRERSVFDAALLDQLPDLKLLITTGMVNASIDMDAAKARGITVCGTPGSRGAAAEHAWALVMALARHIPTEVEGLRSGDPAWQKTIGFELRGKTLGIAGFGNLGQRMARFALAFDMDVVAWSRSLTEEIAAPLNVQRAENLDVLLAKSDVLSLHLPLAKTTRGMIGTRELGLMKPGSYLINTARGPIVDETAMIEALKSGQLGGAGVDVFEIEPLPTDHPFRALPNVVATPHIGYVTQETYEIYYRGAVEAVAAYLDGEPIRVLNS